MTPAERGGSCGGVPLAALLLMGAVLLPSPSEAQMYPRSMDARIRWAQSERVGPLMIAGLVTNVATGNAVPSATVQALGTDLGAVVDSTRHFAFTVPGPGLYRLRVEGIGYEPAEDTVRVGRLGVLVHASVREQRVPICERMWCRDCPTAGVRVEVRDGVTGEIPSDSVTLMVAAAGRSESVTALLGGGEPRGVLFAGGDLGVDGPFRVRVVARGYAPWETTDIWLEYANCVWSPLLHAWLLPLR